MAADYILPSNIVLNSPSGWSVNNLDVSAKVWINVADNSGYYTWYTAVAGSATPNTPFGTESPYSICQSGWHLPTVEQIIRLKQEYPTFYLLKQPPTNFIDGSGCLSATSWGCYWGSTLQYHSPSLQQGAVLNYSIGGDYLGNDTTDGAGYGGLIRCLVK